MPSNTSVAPASRLQLCGNAVALRPDGTPLPLERRDAAMLALLAIEGPTPRLRLMALLWPEEAPERVRNRLRQRVHALKLRLGVDALTGQATMALAPTLQWAGFEQEPPDRPFLGDDDHSDLPELAQWVAAIRERRRQLQLDRLAADAAALEAQGRLAEALVLAGQLLGLDPLQEPAHRRLMRLHQGRGDRAAALLAFDRCEQILKIELGAAPSAETLALLKEIEDQRGQVITAGRRQVPASVLRPPRLVGRDAEWARLLEAWERGESVLLVGEAGMGKSRLMGDLMASQAAAPGRGIQVSARPGDERVPYALLGRLLRALLANRAVPLADGVVNELSRLLPELPQTDRRASDEASLQVRFVGAIETTLADAVSAGLQAVALDDLHFADEASLDMLHHLASASRPRWLVAYRDAEVQAVTRELAATLLDVHRAEPLVLQPLSVAQVAELVDSLRIGGMSGADMAEGLHRRTGGNPMFLLETLKALLQDPASGDLRAVARLPAGTDVTRLIERRIGLLSRDAVRLARCAAIAGQDFSAALAAAVLDANPLDLADAWAELEAAQVLRDGAFAHDLVFEAARRSVPMPIAGELHRRLAEWLQAREAPAARVAAHWLGAGDERQAAPQLALAGRQAMRALRFREGLDYLDQAQAALARIGDVDGQMRVLADLVEAAKMAATTDEARRIADAALAAATTDRQRSLVLAQVASLVASRGEFAQSVALAERALAHALAARDRACEFGARVALAGMLGDVARAHESDSVLAPIEAWTEAHGTPMQKLELSDAKAKVYGDSNRQALALAQWERTLEIAREFGFAEFLPMLMSQLGIAQGLVGLGAAARRTLEQAYSLVAELPGHSMKLRVWRLRLQHVDRELGRFDTSLELALQVLDDAAASPHERDLARLYLAMAYVDLGQPARAQQLDAEAAAEPPNAPTQFVWAGLRIELARPGAQRQALVREAVGRAHLMPQANAGRASYPVQRLLARFADPPTAIEAGRRGLRDAVSAGMLGHRLVFLSLLAKRLAEVGETGEAVRLVREAQDSPADVCPTAVYRGLLWQMQAQVLQGHDDALWHSTVRRAADWIYRTAADHVPPQFRDSFLRRNPSNAFLLELARQL